MKRRTGLGKEGGTAQGGEEGGQKGVGARLWCTSRGRAKEEHCRARGKEGG